jgi:hypothetical protein
VRVVNLDTDFQLKGMFYGAPGSEKTRFSASCALDPRTAPCLMISAMGNPLSLRDFAKKPTIIELSKYSELSAIHSWLAAGQPQDAQLWKALGSPKEKFKSVVCDGLTYLQRWAAMEASGNLGKKVGDVPEAMSQQHHGAVLMRMNFLADKFYALNMHVIFTSLEYEQVDGQGNRYFRPQLTGQAAGEFPSYAYIVGRLVPRLRISARNVGAQLATPITDQLTKKDPKADTIMLLRPSTLYYSKNQYCKGPAYIASPTVTKILDMIGGVDIPEEDDAGEVLADTGAALVDQGSEG